MAQKTVRTRRAPGPAARLRDADRSREVLLEAALSEFAAKGYAGARISDIAARAGVNKQLISYYFGGKDGLYQALVERWLRVEADVTNPGMSAEELILAYIDLIRTQPELFRLFVWEALAYPRDGASNGVLDADPTAAPEVADLTRRQREGELSREFDPAYLLLMLMAITLTPIALAHQVKHFTGLEPDSSEFVARFREQVSLLVRHLAPPERSRPSPPAKARPRSAARSSAKGS